MSTRWAYRSLSTLCVWTVLFLVWCCWNADARATQQCWVWVCRTPARPGTEWPGARTVTVLQVLQIQSVMQGHEVRVTRDPPERHVVLERHKDTERERERECLRVKEKIKKHKTNLQWTLHLEKQSCLWVLSEQPRWPVTSHEAWEDEGLTNYNHWSDTIPMRSLSKYNLRK